MLVQFRIENHRSLRDEQTLSLVASSSDPEDPRLIACPGLGESLLPAVALYGANASGKSNVLHAFAFARDAVLDSHRLWEPDSGTPRDPFALADKFGQPSLFELDALIGGVRHRYGFVLGPTGVEEEWLHVWPRGRKQMWFEREGERCEFGKHLSGENETIRRLTRPNSLFLSAAAQNNHALLLPLFGWFHAAQCDLRRDGGAAAIDSDVLEDMFLETGRGPGLEHEHGRQRDRAAIVRLMCAADLGILDMRLRPRESDRFRRELRRLEVDLLFRHRTADDSEAWLPLAAESAGTVTLLDIATRLVGVLRRGGLLWIDELEASLHPMLALELLRLFQTREHNPHGAQLVFTTHDTNLLGNLAGEPSLRRDQIWFTEKDQGGATHLYPLTDFHPRKEENLERGYLQGRYGAIPMLSALLPAEER